MFSICHIPYNIDMLLLLSLRSYHRILLLLELIICCFISTQSSCQHVVILIFADIMFQWRPKNHSIIRFIVSAFEYVWWVMHSLCYLLMFIWFSYTKRRGLFARWVIFPYKSCKYFNNVQWSFPFNISINRLLKMRICDF